MAWLSINIIHLRARCSGAIQGDVADCLCVCDRQVQNYLS